MFMRTLQQKRDKREKCLTLEYKAMDDKSADTLEELVYREPNIISLKLTGNSFSSGAVFRTVLEQSTTLTELHLRFNSIGPEGAKDIAKALQTNRSLKLLDLNDNCIGDDGAEELALALKRNNTLRELRIQGNGIGDRGGWVLLSGFTVNTSIEVLEMSNGYLDTSLWERILWVVDTRLQRKEAYRTMWTCAYAGDCVLALLPPELFWTIRDWMGVVSAGKGTSKAMERMRKTIMDRITQQQRKYGE